MRNLFNKHPSPNQRFDVPHGVKNVPNIIYENNTIPQNPHALTCGLLKNIHLTNLYVGAKTKSFPR